MKQTKQANNPLYGVTLKQIVSELVQNLGWEEMFMRVRINCFYSDPSIKSSLKFLRKTNWARIKVEKLYIEEVLNSDVSNNDYYEKKEIPLR